jgi:hypothetical protein
MSLDQLLSFRPSPSLSGYRTPVGRLFLTGAGTHPGGGVTGCPPATPPPWSSTASAPPAGTGPGGCAANWPWPETPPTPCAPCAPETLGEKLMDPDRAAEGGRGLRYDPESDWALFGAMATPTRRVPSPSGSPHHEPVMPCSSRN